MSHSSSMSRCNVATTTSLQATPAAGLHESPELKDFMRREAQLIGLTTNQYRQRLIDRFGSAQQGMKGIEAARAEDEAAIEYERSLNVQPMQLGRKPESGELVKFAQLSRNLRIRIWPGDLYRTFSFDFVDAQGQYMKTPSDVDIYTEPVGGSPGGRVLSIEASLQRARTQSTGFDRAMSRDERRADPLWETYVILEGTRLRIEKAKQVFFVNIPMRTQQGRELVLQDL